MFGHCNYNEKTETIPETLSIVMIFHKMKYKIHNKHLLGLSTSVSLFLNRQSVGFAQRVPSDLWTSAKINYSMLKIISRYILFIRRNNNNAYKIKKKNYTKKEIREIKD